MRNSFDDIVFLAKSFKNLLKMQPFTIFIELIVTIVVILRMDQLISSRLHLVSYHMEILSFLKTVPFDDISRLKNAGSSGATYHNFCSRNSNQMLTMYGDTGGNMFRKDYQVPSVMLGINSLLKGRICAYRWH